MKYRKRFSVLQQQAELVRYLCHCRCYSDEAAWAQVEAWRRDHKTLRDLYGLLDEAIKLGVIAWRDGRFVEVEFKRRKR